MATKPHRAARARVAPEIEREILRLAFDQPLFGQDRVARELRARRMTVSASGVRYVWQRHGLETLEKRVRQIEAAARSSEQLLTSVQLDARARARASRRSRRAGLSKSSQAAGEFRRDKHILAVAARLFRERGYDATALRDIARRAAIPVGSLHYHFPAKDALFAAVYEESIARVARHVKEAIDSVRHPWEKLQAACAAHLRMLCANDDFIIVPLAERIHGLDPRMRARLVALNDSFEDIYRTLVNDLALPEAIDRGLLRLQILGAVIWTSVWYKPGKATPDEIAANLIRALRLPLVQAAASFDKKAPRS
jgi:TetR/AcrR family transcriptional regulator, cholesterol catabolism regulator